jgi:regulator of CtrA degradation
MIGYPGKGAHLTRRVIDAHYLEAMVLADEARSYFDQAGRDERTHLNPILRVSFACESLKVTTRLMHVIAWLLTQRAVDAGEITAAAALNPSRRLGPPAMSDTDVLAKLPERARDIADASAGLFDRIARLDAEMEREHDGSPVHAMRARLSGAF